MEERFFAGDLTDNSKDEQVLANQMSFCSNAFFELLFNQNHKHPPWGDNDTHRPVRVTNPYGRQPLSRWRTLGTLCPCVR